MKTGCWKFISSVMGLRRMSKEHGISEVEKHLQECERCNKNYEIVQKPLFKIIRERCLPC